MIANDRELEATLQRLARLRSQAAHLRSVETSPANLQASVSGFLAEIGRMQVEVRKYLSRQPAEQVAAQPPSSD